MQVTHVYAEGSLLMEMGWVGGGGGEEEDGEDGRSCDGGRVRSAGTASVRSGLARGV